MSEQWFETKEPRLVIGERGFRPNVLIDGKPAEEELIQTAIQRVLKIVVLIGLAVLGVWLWRK